MTGVVSDVRSQRLKELVIGDASGESTEAVVEHIHLWSGRFGAISCEHDNGVGALVSRHQGNVSVTEAVILSETQS
jgi:hypothetical protein